MSPVWNIAWGIVFGFIILIVIFWLIAIIFYAIFGDNIRDGMNNARSWAKPMVVQYAGVTTT